VLTVPILLTGPEEASQTVLPPAWNDVRVQVWDALTDLVVDRDERTVGLHPVLDGARNAPHISEVRLDGIVGKIGERLDMRARGDQRVPVENGPVIEERNDEVVLVDDRRIDLPASDGAEDTRLVGDRILLG